MDDKQETGLVPGEEKKGMTNSLDFEKRKTYYMQY